MKLGESVLIIFAIVMGIILLPFTLVATPFLWLQNKTSKKDYEDYLKEIDGKNFFCYNNREKGKDFITNEVLPFLPDNIEILFLNGRKVESGVYNRLFISEAFYQFKNYNRFPQLLKIRNGKAIDISLNHELFECINQKKDKQLIFNKIDIFF
ncbi:hypothetical protein [Flammeovirga sp. SJP92]|uniref:hypothetical protein n=1 Tax=Flammeovirga sp. SJP92 TaxID=1775430 RepID=UPI000786C910|nr:hypothetical protein [Flammeovirga sp. SJP92]KXX66631.1 hypothetical protein AVL50_31545 [Flammeovirga sp. SJP92]